MLSVKLSENQSVIPIEEIGVRPSCDNLKTDPLALSVKYILKLSVAKDSGFVDIP